MNYHHPILVLLAMLFLLAGCKKENTSETNTTTNNNPVQPDTSYVTLYAIARHHGRLIPSLTNYSDTLLIKNHTMQFPGFLPADYDTFYTGTVNDTFIKVKLHQPDSLYLFMAGWDSLGMWRVIGGLPLLLTSDTGTIYLNVPVTE